MSVRIYWEVHNPEGKRLSKATSFFVDAMCRVGCSLPVLLTEENIPVLRGMAAVTEMNPDGSNVYYDLIELIKEYKTIRLTAEY